MDLLFLVGVDEALVLEVRLEIVLKFVLFLFLHVGCHILGNIFDHIDHRIPYVLQYIPLLFALSRYLVGEVVEEASEDLLLVGKEVLHRLVTYLRGFLH